MSQAMRDERPEPKWRPGCLFYCSCALLLAGIGLSISFRVWHQSASKELGAEMAAIRQRVEPLWFADLTPESVEPRDDGTPLFLSAISEFRPPPPAFNELITSDPNAPTVFPSRSELVEQVLGENQKTLELLSRALKKPYFRLPIDYQTSSPITIILEPVQKAREIAQLAAGRVFHSIATNDRDQAVVSTLELLKLAEILRREPFLVTQMVRIAIAARAIDSLESLLGSMELTPEHFAELDEQLAEMETNFRLTESVRSERAMMLTTMETMGDDPALLDSFVSDGQPVARIMSFGGFGPLRMRDEAFMLRLMTALADVVDTPGPNGHAAVQALEGTIRPSLNHILSNLMTPAVGSARKAGLRHRQRLINARIGLRVLRFRHQTGAFPKSLEQVTDDKLPAIAADLFAAQPLVYRPWVEAEGRESSGFLIYPVGDNGTDDGAGEADPQEQGARFKVQLNFVPASGP